ncbi:SLAP domain-containing protein [Companilactobacillus muriivasis]|uniref:SLAP domain-containing protein n=1 Tax=Companilactobacillus muriivasis TaxID=3081444 RepID=UPI0030C6FF8C
MKFIDSQKNKINTTDTEGMFKNDSKLTEINLSKNDVTQIENISHMFENDTSLQSITFSKNSFQNITDGRYAFANDVKLQKFISTDKPDLSSTNAWRTNSEALQTNSKVIINLISMFKNDISLDSLNLFNWSWAKTTKTGDSTINEGMFDGTNLNSIALNPNLRFNPNTYLTSNKGTSWKGYTKDHDIYTPTGDTFTGIPISKDDGTIINGLGYFYNGSGNHLSNTSDVVYYHAVENTSQNITVTNQVTIHTNLNYDVTTNATGTIGRLTPVTPKEQWTFPDGKVYYLEPNQEINAVLGLTQSTANETAIYKLKPANGEKNKEITIDGQKITIDIPDGSVSNHTEITISEDNLPKGYTFKQNTINTIKITYNNDDSKNPYTIDSSEIEIVPKSVSENHASINTPVGSKDFTIPAGTIFSKSKPFTLPQVDGYTTNNVIAVYNPEGTVLIDSETKKVIDPTDSSIYKGKETQPGSFEVTLKDGSHGSTDYGTEYVGKTVFINSPEILGYKPDQKQIKGIIDVKGKFIPDPDSTYSYTGDTVKKSELTVPTPEGNKTITIPQGNIGTSTTIDLPEVPGYTTKKIKVKYVVDENKQETVIFQDYDDKTVDPSKINNYQGNNTDPGTYTFTLKDGSKAEISYGKETVGKKVQFKAPTINGYHTEPGAQITGTINAEGKLIPDSSPDSIYQGDILDVSHKSVNTPSGAMNLEIPKGTVGTSKQIDLPEVSGYTTSKITVIYNANKTVTLLNDKNNVIDLNKLSNYIGKRFNSGTFHFKLNDKSAGSTTYGPVSVGNSLKIKSPAIKGYTPVNEEISGKIDSNGDFIPDNPKDLNYTPITLTGHSQTILTPVGKETLQIPDGKVGTSTPITLPGVDGYTSPKFQVNYGPNGITISDINNNHSIDFNNSNFYTGVTVAGAKLIVKNPNGLETITLTIPEGKYGDNSKTISAPNLPGYFAPTIIATYQPDGTLKIIDAKNPKLVIDQKQTLTYKKKPSRGSSHHNIKRPDVSYTNPIKQTISTFADKVAVQIFQLDSNKQMNFVTNRVLNNAISWNSDAKITVNGINYYRIAANEWAQANQVYSYNPIDERIRTYDDSAKLLYQAENKLISNRELSVNSAWITDRETEINGQQYYRVATNEFVNANDVYIYSPVNLIVTTHKVQTKIYTAKGDLVTDRSLANNTSWKVDSITYINNEKYYRVATNEFIKASDIAVKDVH